MQIQRENYEDGGGDGDTALFVEAAKRAKRSDATGALIVEGGNGDVNIDRNSATQQKHDNSTLHEDITKGSNNVNQDGGVGKGKTDRGGGGMVDGVNIMTDVTETTDNMNFMANRLRSLQERRGGLQRIRGSLNFSSTGVSSRSNVSSTSDDSSSSIMGHETSGDKLIDALNSVDSSKNKSFLSKIRSEYTELIVPKLPIFRQNIAHILLYMVLPFLSVAAVLFYMFDNPMAGNSGTSVSWWILFLGVRQPIIFELTLVGEVFWVEIFALRSKLFNRVVGPYISLVFIQSRGW